MFNFKKWSIGPVGLLLSALFFIFIGMLLSSGWTEIMENSVSQEFQLTAQNPSKIYKETSAQTQVLDQAKAPSSHLRPNILEQVNTEAQAIKRIAPDPKGTLARLKKLALKLDFQEMQKLKEVVLNDKENGDKRMMSVFLLSQVTQEEVLDLLKDIAAHPIKDSKVHSGLLEEELVVRAQAIEGLGKFKKTKSFQKVLNHLHLSLKHSFLSERLKTVLSK